LRKFENIARLMRIKRHQLGLSQNDIAKMIGFSSSGQFVSNVERGLCSIPFRKIKTTAHILEIEPSELIEAILNDERLFMNQIVAGSEVAVMTTKQFRQKKLEERVRKRCEKISKPTSPVLSATQQPKAETHTITSTLEKPTQNIHLESGTLSKPVKDAINAFFTQAL